MSKVLFICKQRKTEYGVSYGLLNSCKFICNALNSIGIESKVVSVIDNNFIDKEVHNYKPTHVFIEALWVVPEKFNVLLPLYPNIKWYIRLHSNIPFLSNEGIAIQWIKKYEEIGKKYNNLFISANSSELVYNLNKSLHINSIYSPNIYFPNDDTTTDFDPNIENNSDIINIGCFGAIRPLKNHLMQAVAAIIFANKIEKTLQFHINTRCEQNGESLYRNLFHLFENTKHKLIEHQWKRHEEFIKIVKEMDIGMQVSFSETFNLVAADIVSQNIPFIGSKEVFWISRIFKTNPNRVKWIVLSLYIAYYGRKIKLQVLNKLGLKFHNFKALRIWKKLL